MKKFVIIFSVAFVLGMVSACTHSNEHHHDHELDEHEHGHEGHDHEHHHHGANVVEFSNAQGLKVGLTLEKVAPRTFGQVIKTTAQVLPSPEGASEAVAKASGVVRLTNSALVEGAAVKAGQQLCTIVSDGMADNNMSVRFAEASARYNSAKATYERKKKLAEDKIVSQSDLEAARAEYETAKAAYDNLKGNFSKNGAVVKAPISGYVQQIHVSNGGYVEAGQPVFTISQNRDLQIRAEVQPRYYSVLKDIAEVTIRIPGDEHVYTLKELGGSLVSYGKATDAACPMVPVIFRVRNTGVLLSGGFVTLYISTRSNHQAITIPNEGLVEEMGNFFVFVKVCDGEYEKHLVTIGATDGLRTEILSGVNEGDIVVAHGASMVKLAQGAGALDPHAGHVH